MIEAFPYPTDVMPGPVAVVVHVDGIEEATDAEIASAVRANVDGARYNYALYLCRFRDPLQYPDLEPIAPCLDAEAIERVESELAYVRRYEDRSPRVRAAVARFKEWLQWQRSHPKVVRAVRSQMSSRYAKIRAQLVERDGEACAHCGAVDDLQVDHMMPVSRGGTNDLGNLQLLCSSCNASKGARTMDEWNS